MALKLIGGIIDEMKGFGPIQNYMALKPLHLNIPFFLSFGPIQNYMALKHGGRV